MDGMLSQDEINALLAGMANGDIPTDEPAADSSSEPVAEEPVMAGGGSPTIGSSTEVDESLLTDIERDAIGEVANISMGSSATTLYSLVNKKVNITTPVVSVATWDSIILDYEKPCVFIQIKYTQGLDGSNILILREKDVKIITDLMMGGDGTNTDGELGELHLSAISEAMNQMMGSSATSLSSMLGKMIDISPPEASLVDLLEFKKPSEIAAFLEGNFCKIAFSMQIEDLVDSTILQLYPIDFAKSLYDTFIGQQMGDMGSAEPEPEPAPAPSSEPASFVPPQVDAGAQMDPNMMNPQMMGGQMGMNPMMNPQMMGGQMGMPMMNPQMMGMPMMGMNPMMGGQMGMPMMDPSQMPNIQPASFQNFSTPSMGADAPENIGLIMDVPLEVTVELGRCTKSIQDILNFSPGTIIELDRIAGEPIDVLVNGKFVAKGEVVVIEESFGIRVTDIIKQ